MSRSKIKLGFCVFRNAQYRTLGPLIVESSKRDEWESWHVLGPGETGKKSYLSPELDTVPEVFRESSHIYKAENHADFIQQLRSCDVVISTVGRGFVDKDGDLDLENGPIWCAVEDCSHSGYPGHRFDDAELTAWSGKSNFEMVPSLIHSEIHLLGEEEARRRCDKIQATGRLYGWIRGEGVRSFTPQQARAWFGLPEDKSVVLFNPDGYRFNPDMVRTFRGKQYPMHLPEYKYLWCERSRRKRLAYALKHRKDLLCDVASSRYGELGVLKSMREFCDRNGALLVLARRRKKSYRNSMYTPDELKYSDYALERDDIFPQSFLMGCRAADLVISAYASDSCMDAAAAGVPYLTLNLPRYCYHESTFDELGEHYSGDRLHCPGFAWRVDAEEFSQQFRQMTFDDYCIKPDVLARYSKEKVGESFGTGSERILSDLQSLVHTKKN